MYRKLRRYLRSIKWQIRALRLALLTLVRWPRADQRPAILCLGDSHIRPLGSLASSNFRYFVFSVSGATASGIRSLKSETGTLQIFRYAIRRATRVDGVLLCIGEIDAGFLAWVRGTVPGTTPELYLDRVVDRLAEFVRDELVPLGVPVYLVAASHPTVESYADWPDEAFGFSPTLSVDRKLIGADMSQRIELTRYWNAKVGQLCTDQGYGWLDVTPASTNADGTVPADWRSEHPLDHHLNRERYRSLVDQLLADAAGAAAKVQ
jgi:hypothetical protein